MGEKARLDAVSGKKGAKSGEHGERSTARSPKHMHVCMAAEPEFAFFCF